MSHNKDSIKSPHIKSLVLTEYWKVVDSQSGRQSHWVAETFLIALKNLGVSLRLGREFWTCIPSRMDRLPACAAVVVRPLR